MNRLLLEAAVGLALALACYVMYDRWQAASDRADKAEAALAVSATNEKVVTKYVEKIVSVPGPAVIRDRVVRGLCVIPSVPGAGGAAEAAAPDAVDRQGDEAGDAAESIRNAALNQAQCSALLEVVRPQAGK